MGILLPGSFRYTLNLEPPQGLERLERLERSAAVERELRSMVLAVFLVSDLAADVRTPYGRYSWMMVLLIGPGWLVVTFLFLRFSSPAAARANNSRLSSPSH